MLRCWGKGSVNEPVVWSQLHQGDELYFVFLDLIKRFLMASGFRIDKSLLYYLKDDLWASIPA